MKPLIITAGDVDRFNSKWIPEPNSGCWLWTDCVTNKGYGRISIAGKPVSAHRVSMAIANGEDPGKLCVLHKCDNPLCVNPGHLALGTQRDNAIDMCRKGRGNKPRGERHRSAKLTEEAVRQMRQARAEGAPYKVIAKLFGVTTTTAHKAVTGKHWQHVV